ncbi:PREDICTED: uncharacterized protein LOC104814724 isoform X2 [Tarenaya hassleriana]|nr:PREDICTED: uncharacterized protein LOC104814724 isoform X2 [Tarenaya hassleriana]
MEDPNSMTIEFLRARLLAERAVSKSAREKVDELAKRLIELEEQLKIVSLQRKKAEMATVDVLAILEENGFTDVSETYDSSSDHESVSQTKSDKSSTNVVQISVDSGVKNNEINELSASEFDSFPAPGKGISWKGRRSKPSSSEKVKEYRTGRQRSFESVYLPSPRTRQGKSCRQIRHSESRSVVEDYKRDRNASDHQESSVNNSEMLYEEAPKTVPNAADLKKNGHLQKVFSSNCLEKQTSLERALENRARVIGCFGDLERTQREWEIGFRESNISALDLCDPGNHSDVTEESNETKTKVQHQGAAIVTSVLEATSKTDVDSAELCQTPSRLFPGNSVVSQDNQCPTYVSKSMDQSIPSQGHTAEYITESTKSSGFFELSSSPNLSALAQPNLGSAAIIQAGAYPLAPVAGANSSSCDTVLRALRQARLSLQDKVNNPRLAKAGYLSEGSCSSLPVSTINICTIPPEPSIVGSMAEVPVGCAGLFRVPIDFSSDALSSQKNLDSYVQKIDLPLLPQDYLFTETIRKSLPSMSLQSHLRDTSDRLPTTPHIGGSKLWIGFSSDDPLIDDPQRFRPYKSTPSVSDSHISSATSAWEGNRTPPTSSSLDRQLNTYTGTSNVYLPSTSSQSYRDPSQFGTERFSAPYTISSARLLPIDRLGHDD